jgi:flavin-binding protein dodecin
VGPRSGARRFAIAARADRRDYRASFRRNGARHGRELVGTSTESWEKAANAAIQRASKSLRDLRVAEVTQLDMTMDNGKVKAYRAKVKVSFKFEGK